MTNPGGFGLLSVELNSTEPCLGGFGCKRASVFGDFSWANVSGFGVEVARDVIFCFLCFFCFGRKLTTS